MLDVCSYRSLNTLSKSGSVGSAIIRCHGLLASFKRTTGSAALFGPEPAAFEHLNSLFIAMMKNQTDVNRFLLHEQYHSLSLKNCFNVWPETKSTFSKYFSPGFILKVRSCPRVRSPSQSIAGQDSHLVMIRKPVVLNRGRTGADINRRKGCQAKRLGRRSSYCHIAKIMFLRGVTS